MNKIIIFAGAILVASLGFVYASEVRQNDFEMERAIHEECVSSVDWGKLLEEVEYLIFDRSLFVTREDVLTRHISKEDFALLVQENLQEQASYLTSVKILTCALASTMLATGIVFGSVIKKIVS